MPPLRPPPLAEFAAAAIMFAVVMTPPIIH
jgi:hypothetical protein